MKIKKYFGKLAGYSVYVLTLVSLGLFTLLMILAPLMFIEYFFLGEMVDVYGDKSMSGSKVYVNNKHEGNMVWDEESDEYAEILDDKPFRVVFGGRGGMGNHDYNPQLAKFQGRKKEGEKGEVRKIHLILNLIADIGLVGLPNAGKSSILKVITNAVPKVGNYPFTTIEPNLGTLGKIVLADIPGLIKGASDGKGLGIQFLKHIKKTKILLHCIDGSDTDFLENYQIVRNELMNYDKSLAEKDEVILLTKKDLLTEEELDKKIQVLKKQKKGVLSVSIYDNKSVDMLKEAILKLS